MNRKLRSFIVASILTGTHGGCAASSASPSQTCPEPSTAEPITAEPAGASPVGTAPVVAQPEPASPSKSLAVLSSWNDSAARKAIVDFVADVTDPKSPRFVPQGERIAVFDNDGTLWSEQPMYVQLAFALDRVEQLAPQHPEWKRKQPFKAALAGDMNTLAASGNEGLLQLVMATHAGMSAEEFRGVVTEWLKVATHPTYGVPYTQLTYVPMVELLGYLRSHGFKTFIVSGGGIDFMRPWAEAAYGIPPEQIIGSRIKTEFDMETAEPIIQRKPELEFIDDGPGKPVGIHANIGRRPIFAAGNSDGDLHMLHWTAKSPGPHLSLLVHHTDGVRESAYDRQSAMGKLDKALDFASQDGWVVVSMKDDWKTVFSFQAATP